MYLNLLTRTDHHESHTDTVDVFDAEFPLGGVTTVKRVAFTGAETGEPTAHWFIRKGPAGDRTWRSLTDSDLAEHVRCATALEDQYRDWQDERADLDAREAAVRR